MSSTAPSHDILWYSREKDAQWLAGQLRQHRLTVLQGPAGTGKSVLLAHGVLPRLTQRATDPRAATAGAEGRVEVAPPLVREDPPFPSVVVPLPDRRRARQNRSDAEVVVYIDAWDGNPFETLWIALHVSQDLMAAPVPGHVGALVDTLTAWRRERGLRFLMVFDDFDECLKASMSSPAARRLVDEWVQCLSDARSGAHFLIAMTEPAEPLWRLLHRHLHSLGELDTHRLVLPGIALNGVPTDPELSAQPEIAREAVEVPAPSEPLDGRTQRPDPREALGRYRAADVIDRETVAQPATVSADHLFDFAIPDAEDDALPGLHEASTLARPRTPRKRRARSAWPVAIGGLAVLAFIGLLAYGWLDQKEQGSIEHQSAAGSLVGNDGSVSTPSSATPGALPSPPFELVADGGDDGKDLLLADLARLLTAPGQSPPTIRFPIGWEAGLASLQTGPKLEVVSGDEIRAAQRMGMAENLQLVTPLFPEPVYFLVRHNSPLRYTHQLRTARLGVGPATGSQALTAGQLYQRLFGAPLPARQTVTASRKDSLEQLLNNRGIDALVFVGGQPAAWLAQLSPEQRRQVRLLDVDSRSDTTKRAAAFYPVSTLPRDSVAGAEVPRGGVRAFSTMTYLVTGSALTAEADAAIASAASTLCHNLPELQHTGDRWREVRLGGRMPDIGIPVSPVARKALADCQPR